MNKLSILNLNCINNAYLINFFEIRTLKGGQSKIF